MNYLTEHGIGSYEELERRLAARELKRMGTVPVPTTESMKKELAALTAQKEALLSEYRAVRSEAQEIGTIRQNADALLAAPKGQEQQRRHELE